MELLLLVFGAIEAVVVVVIVEILLLGFVEIAPPLVLVIYLAISLTFELVHKPTTAHIMWFLTILVVALLIL